MRSASAPPSLTVLPHFRHPARTAAAARRMDADSKLSRMADELVRTRNELSVMTVSMKNKEVEYQHQIDYLAHHAKKLRPMLQQTNLGTYSYLISHSTRRG